MRTCSSSRLDPLHECSLGTETPRLTSLSNGSYWEDGPQCTHWGASADASPHSGIGRAGGCMNTCPCSHVLVMCGSCAGAAPGIRAWPPQAPLPHGRVTSHQAAKAAAASGTNACEGAARASAWALGLWPSGMDLCPRTFAGRRIHEHSRSHTHRSLKVGGLRDGAGDSNGRPWKAMEGAWRAIQRPTGRAA